MTSRSSIARAWNACVFFPPRLNLSGKHDMPLVFRLVGRGVGKASGLVQGGRARMNELSKGSDLLQVLSPKHHSSTSIMSAVSTACCVTHAGGVAITFDRFEIEGREGRAAHSYVRTCLKKCRRSQFVRSCPLRASVSHATKHCPPAGATSVCRQQLQNEIRSNLDDLRVIKAELRGAAQLPSSITRSSHPGSE